MNKSDITRDYCMLRGPLAKKGYDWWWHSFTAHHKVTGQAKTFYIEYFLCNPALAQPEPVLVWNDPEGRAAGKRLCNSVFEVGGGRPKVFGISLNRKLLGQFYYEGQDYGFNFSKFWTGSRTRFHCRETDTQILWSVQQTTFRAKMEAEIACNKEEMLLINYESPDGYKRHTRLWNCGNGFGTVKLWRREGRRWVLVDDVQGRSVGCEYGEYPPTGQEPGGK